MGALLKAIAAAAKAALAKLNQIKGMRTKANAGKLLRNAVKISKRIIGIFGGGGSSEALEAFEKEGQETEESEIGISQGSSEVDLSSAEPELSEDTPALSKASDVQHKASVKNDDLLAKVGITRMSLAEESVSGLKIRATETAVLKQAAVTTSPTTAQLADTSFSIARRANASRPKIG